MSRMFPPEGPEQWVDEVDEPASLKVGALTAARITREIVASGWPVGRLLGQEADLMDRFFVSRGGLREAMRIIEQDGIAEMRRGRGGGLVVSEPDDSAAIRSMVLFLLFRRVRREHLQEARHVLELYLLPLVVDRMNDENERKLRAYLEQEGRFAAGQAVKTFPRRFHTLLGELTNNPVLELFARCLESLVARAFKERGHAKPERDILALFHARHVAIGEALIARDLGTAQRLLRDTLEMTAEYY